jgi:hypothetical protein
LYSKIVEELVSCAMKTASKTTVRRIVAVVDLVEGVDGAGGVSIGCGLKARRVCGGENSECAQCYRSVASVRLPLEPTPPSPPNDSVAADQPVTTLRVSTDLTP